VSRTVIHCFRFPTRTSSFIFFITIVMATIKHYGLADLYDQDRPVGEVSAGAKIDAVTLGRNVRAWMRNRVRSKTISNPPVLEVSYDSISSLPSNTN